MGLGELEISPLIESVQPDQLAEMVDEATRLDPEYEAVDFGAWYEVATPTGADADEVAKVVGAAAGVTAAYVMRPVPPPVVNASNDPRSSNQGYLDAAPNGIDARYAWGFTGGDGAGIAWVDMEQGWNFNHEDLASAAITLISGINGNYFFHGTSVLGEVAMVDNARGGVGIAPAATARAISQQRTAASYNTADAIVDAVAHMAYGDVLLLEAQEYDPAGSPGYWPVEIADATYEAIRLATALGITVVEAGANGGFDLDAYMNAAGRQIFNRSSVDFERFRSDHGRCGIPHHHHIAGWGSRTMEVGSTATVGERVSTRQARTRRARTTPCTRPGSMAHRALHRS